MKKVIEFTKGKGSIIYKSILIFFIIGILILTYTNKNNDVFLTETITNKEENYQSVKEKNETIIEDNNLNTDKEENTEMVNENSNTKNETESINSAIIKENMVAKSADDEIIAYMNETESFFDEVNKKEEIKVRFITIVDFLFYKGQIKGYTLDDLTSMAKLQILKIALSIDNKIEKHFPFYKESISNTTGKIYTGIKNKIIEIYFYTTTKICDYDKNLCDSAKKDFQEMKKAFAISWDFIKNLILNEADNLKTWYEIYSGKLS